MGTGPSAAGPSACSPEAEQARLEEVADWFDSRMGINRLVIQYAAARILANARGQRALEMGCANGVMTQELARHFRHLDVVEAVARYAAHARRWLPPGGHVYETLFEEFRPPARYQVIVMGWVLEHVIDPREVLSRARGWLDVGGQIHVVVPNAESLHRRVGQAMGLLQQVDELNPSDLAIGHRRVYTWDTLSADFAAAGLRVTRMEGILLKPLPNTLMENWPRELLSAFFRLSHLQPRLCSEVYAVCERS